MSDFDGDGVSDLTVFRPSTGTWFTTFSSTGFATITATQFGLNGDIRVNGDYDGDHRTDLAVYRPSTASGSSCSRRTGSCARRPWGVAATSPMPADYDGDGRTDLAVFRPSTGEWFVDQLEQQRRRSSRSGACSGGQPFARDFDGDGRADLAVYRPSTNQWFLRLTTTAFGPIIVADVGPGGRHPDAGRLRWRRPHRVAVYRPSTGEWFAIDAMTGALVINAAWGLAATSPSRTTTTATARIDPAVFRPSAAHVVRPPLVERRAAAGAVGSFGRCSALKDRRDTPPRNSRRLFAGRLE